MTQTSDPQDRGEPSLLLDFCHAKWRDAEWSQLAAIRESQIASERSRDKLALLIAGAHAQLGDMDLCAHFLQRSETWGSSREDQARVLLSSVHNSLAIAALAINDHDGSESHIKSSITIMAHGEDIAESARRRYRRETFRAGLLVEAADTLEAEISGLAELSTTSEERLWTLTSDVEALRTELRALRKRRVQQRATPTQPPLTHRQDTTPPFVVVVAGVPRSGSTWLFNALRLICQHSGLTCYAQWRDDYTPAEHQDCDIHLVKLHEPKQLNFQYHRLFTSRRELVERLGSLLRMGWLPSDPETIRARALDYTNLDIYWSDRSNFEAEYDDITKRPASVIQKLASMLEIDCLEDVATLIATELDGMSVPKERPAGKRAHDPKTLLHPGHRATAEERRDCIAHVRRALAGSHFD